jgi:DNA repair protein RadC
VDVFARAKLKLAEKVVEHFVVILLDARHRPIGWSLIAKGGISSCPVSPADVFRVAMSQATCGLVMLHNHPSGDPTPSPEDIELTERLVGAGKILGVPVLDHVVVAEEGYFSFLDAGLIGVER